MGGSGQNGVEACSVTSFGFGQKSSCSPAVFVCCNSKAKICGVCSKHGQEIFNLHPGLMMKE